ncbi:MAG TPA: hypothetical protein VN426_17215 [Syntrophomonadaceae bacterium]|nr:hypothetical protein [Syntrophomonadaceae bacterium]
MKKSKSALLLIVLLVIGLGIIGYNLVKDPALRQKVPGLKNLFPVKTQTDAGTELQNLKQENDNLKKGVAQKDQELQSVQKQLADLSKQAAGSGGAGQTDKSNNQQADQQSKQAAQKSTYQDIAKYFTEMKSTEAADILSRLNDEDVIGILGQMPADTAAAILQNMDHDKAAAISKKMLITAPAGG